MFSKRRARLVTVLAFAAIAGGGLFVLGSRASTNVDPAPVDDRAGMADYAMITPWSAYLSNDAVDAKRIEADLDGNASALYPSDWAVRLP